MKGRSVLAIAAAFSLLATGRGEARADGEVRPLYRGTRASAMGGAFVAIADDEQAIFMNPAGLAGVNGFSFNYAAADLEISTDTLAMALQGANAFSDFSPAALNELMGKHIFAHAQVTPSIVMPSFGFAFLSDHQVSFTEQNQANPQIKLGYQSTNGIQMSFGRSVLGRRSRRHDLRVGLGAKIMWRRGGYHDLGFTDILKLSSDAQGYISELNGSYGVGYGADFGLQYLYAANKRLTLSSGLVMTDIGDTMFSQPTAEMQKSNLTWGLGATFKLPKAKVNVAYDMRNLMSDMEFRKKSHLGVEFALPLVSLQAGIYQMALTYGASVDFWVFRISGASYSEEKGTIAMQNPERRYALRIAMKLGF